MVSNDFFHPHGPLSDNRYFWYFSWFSNFYYFYNSSNLLRTAVYGKNLYETVCYEENSFGK